MSIEMRHPNFQMNEGRSGDPTVTPISLSCAPIRVRVNHKFIIPKLIVVHNHNLSQENQQLNSES